MFKTFEQLGIVSVTRARGATRGAGWKVSNQQASEWLAPYVAAAKRAGDTERRLQHLERGRKKPGRSIEHEADGKSGGLADGNSQAGLLDQMLADGLISRGFGRSIEHEADGNGETASGGRKRGRSIEHEADGNADRPSRAHVAKELVRPGLDTPLRSVSRTDITAGAHELRERDPEVWVPKLRTEINAIRDVRICELEVEQRLLLGRYHAYRFANCTKSLARNRAAGSKIMVGFAKMASSDLYADLTVAQYVAAAVRFHDVSGGTPWRDPFQIRALEDPEPRRVAR